MSAGLAPAADYDLANVNAPGTTIVWKNTATVLKKYQKVWLDYTIGTTTYTDVEKQLNNTTTVAMTVSGEAAANASEPAIANAPA